MPPINFNPAVLGIGLIIVVYLVYAATQARKRRRLQHQLLAAAAETPGNAAFRMRHASAARFAGKGKLPAWEGSGMMRRTESGLVYEGMEASGTPVRLEIPASENAKLADRAAASGEEWLEIKTLHGDNYYFLPDAGAGLTAGAVLDVLNAHLLVRRMGDGPTA